MFSSSTVAVFVGGDPACTDDTCALIFRNNIQASSDNSGRDERERPFLLAHYNFFWCLFLILLYR